MLRLPASTTLLLVDVQKGFDDASWGRRNNPAAEGNISRLLAAWRQSGRPVIHVHHVSLSPRGSFRPGTPGNDAKAEAAPVDSEPVYRKTVNSAFIGTSLTRDLQEKGVTALVIVGLTTNHCVSTTTRMAGNLGFETYIVADATATFDAEDINGRIRSAEDVHIAALSDLQHEFAEVVFTQDLLAAATAAAA